MSYIAHKPYPSNIIKCYVMKQVLLFVNDNKLIEELKEEQKNK